MVHNLFVDKSLMKKLIHGKKSSLMKKLTHGKKLDLLDGVKQTLVILSAAAAVVVVMEPMGFQLEEIFA